MSSGSPMWPSGTWRPSLASASSLPNLWRKGSRIGVSIKVGWMEFDRISSPCLAQCSAMPLESSQTAAFDAL